MIYYWPIQFRGNFLKLILEEKGIKYSCTRDWESMQQLMAKEIKQREFPYFAPPILKHGDFISSQMAASAQYLAKKYNMDAKSLEDSTHALMICMNANDILCELTRNCGAQQWTDVKDWQTFKSTRLVRWLDILTELLQRNASNDTKDAGKTLFYFGTDVTYADTSVFHVLYSLISFMRMKDLVESSYPLLYRFYEQIYSRPNINAFIKQQEADKLEWCGGLIEKSMLAMMEQEQGQQKK
eukprot:CAMPEP_0202698330 /NCGR_PEP_ID=MMETSP1385-20130828/11601_1 /ASSEMBLY_ACC=CAM_ASM_000861 /TAXON_ID=933848 /ORGANISM="Elphidium margaritaceum" /LENGTH=239 /DNA_ID=CAMNT_0049355017 /DNA_START=49 /DNA_END=768 /DNA_ORIENTATION=-